METQTQLQGNKVTELGISINDISGDKPKTKLKRCNLKLKIYREFTLATLNALVELKTKNVRDSTTLQAPMQVYALDAIACSGIAGIQWKKHLSEHVHVTLADQDDTSQLMHNAMNNSLSCSELKLNPLRIAGELFNNQKENEVHVCKADPRIILTLEAFNFIFLNPHKNAAFLFEPALQSLTCGGLLCLVIPDVSMFARSPHVVKRYFDANVIKTEYLKEMSARIILANLARAAAKFNKGISSQYVLSHEDNLLICVKVSRGNGATDISISEVERLLHCRFCEERIFMRNQLAPQEEPYNLLSCNCKKKNPGKTAVILGPMWKGPLNNPDFLKCMHEQGKQLHLSSKFAELLQILVVETYCAQSDKTAVEGMTQASEFVPKASNQENSKHNNCNQLPTSDSVLPGCFTNCSQGKTDLGNQCNNQKMVPESDAGSTTDSQSTALTVMKPLCLDSKFDDGSAKEENIKETNKRKAEDNDGNSESLTTAKRRRKSNGDAYGGVSVPFYYRVSKFKRTNIPKLDKLVIILQSHGHKASRTHFDSSAIRTSASVEEFLHILN